VIEVTVKGPVPLLNISKEFAPPLSLVDWMMELTHPLKKN